MQEMVFIPDDVTNDRVLKIITDKFGQNQNAMNIYNQLIEASQQYYRQVPVVNNKENK